jgi:DNA-binding LytR/AlgR family response regulator
MGAKRIGTKRGAFGTAGTNGGPSGMSGANLWSNRPLRVAIWIAAILLPTTVNAFSQLTEASWRGTPVPSWLPFTLEYSSAVAMWAMIVFYLHLRPRLVPAALGWRRSMAAHLAVAPLFCLGHFALMNGLRMAIWASFLGRPYRIDWIAELPYEARKDLASFLAFMLLAAVLERLAAQPGAAPLAIEPAATAPPSGTIELRSGSRTFFLRPDEVQSASAAGNYVEMATAQGSVLARLTLAAIETQLGANFVRIHRSHLVARAEITRIETNASGDFSVTLRDGRSLPGSRRYRANLDA